MIQRPMPLVRIPEPFDHLVWVFELKHEGFRALAYIRGHHCQLVSRRGHVYKFDLLARELAHAVRVMDAILDGEIVCLAPDGRSLFHQLLFRRDWPYFVAFDLLQVDGQDIRSEPLVTRKRRLRAIMPRVESRVLYLPRVERRGVDLFAAVCERDLEGVVAKWKRGPYYSDGVVTNWLKIKNPDYSQMAGRRELFEHRNDAGRLTRTRSVSPLFALER